MTTNWQLHYTQPGSTGNLPMAIAMLVPGLTTVEKEQKLAEILNTAPFVTSIWLGTSLQPIQDFAAARNLVLSQITEPWVFWLDSDELLENPVEAYHQFKIAFSKPLATSWQLQRQDLFHQRTLNHGEVGRVELLRLHHLEAGKFINQVHEVFQTQTAMVQKTLPVKIFHHSHGSVGQFLAKISQYAQIRARERFNQTSSPSSTRLIWELLWWPVGKFLKNYLWLQGFRDGYRGLIYAVMMSVHSSLVRIFGLEMLLKNQPTKTNEN